MERYLPVIVPGVIGLVLVGCYLCLAIKRGPAGRTWWVLFAALLFLATSLQILTVGSLPQNSTAWTPLVMGLGFLSVAAALIGAILLISHLGNRPFAVAQE